MDNKKKPKRFDMLKKPERQKNYLRPITWLLSFPEVWIHRLKITKVNMKGLKPPYLLLCTHMAFMDFKVTTAAIFPHRANYIVAIDGFIGREKLLRKVGCICKRKFTNDIKLVSQIRYAIEKFRDVMAIYPEARYSLAGTTAILPESLGKLAKHLKIPVVVLKMHGNYINSPCWNLKKRGNRIEAEMSQIITAEQLKTMSANDVNKIINEAFIYDEYAWQKEKNVVVKYKDNAKGLHKILYQCPHCLTEYEMNSGGNKIWCESCGKEWIMSGLGELKATEGITEFSHIPDWYEFEREFVRKQIEEGTYKFTDVVIVDSLPNSQGYIRLGKGILTHDMNGFILESVFDGETFLLKKEPQSMYSCHIEYEYMGKGDCVDLSTMDDTYYIYPQGKEFSVTKMALATEELYKHYVQKIPKKGMAVV